MLGNPQDYIVDTPAEYTDPDRHDDGRIYLQSLWDGRPQYLQHARSTFRPEDYLAIFYHALEANVVMSTGAKSGVKVQVTRDGKGLDESVAGSDVRFENGKSFVVVEEPRMYNIVRDHEYGIHALKLAATSNQLQVYAFTFGGCKM